MKRYLPVIFVVIVLVGAGVSVFGRHKADTPASQSTPSKGEYVALGDSVAAGLGLQPYTDSSACDRTNVSYPNQVANQLHLTLTNLACSDATTTSGIIGSQNVNNLQVDPQLSQLFSKPKPRVISLTIGANDINWTDFLASCYRAACGTADDTASARVLLDTLGNNLRTALSQISEHYGSTVPPVVVTGYYQVMPEAAGTCSDLSGVTADEQAWVRQEFSVLNSTIQGALSGFNFAHYASIDFAGHELCSPSPWVQGLQDPAPYHPTQSGQAAIAAQVSRTMKTATGDNNL